MSQYALYIMQRAQQWLDKELPSIAEDVMKSLNELCRNPKGMGKVVRNPALWRPNLGQPYRFAIYKHYESLGGLRVIYYVVDEPYNRVIVYKIGTHADDVYENGN